MTSNKCTLYDFSVPCSLAHWSRAPCAPSSPHRSCGQLSSCEDRTTSASLQTPHPLFSACKSSFLASVCRLLVQIFAPSFCVVPASEFLTSTHGIVWLLVMSGSSHHDGRQHRRLFSFLGANLLRKCRTSCPVWCVKPAAVASQPCSVAALPKLVCRLRPGDAMTQG